MEVLKENAQEDEAFLQEKMNEYGLQDLYCFLNQSLIMVGCGFRLREDILYPSGVLGRAEINNAE